jgi:hypothetical protein
MASGHASWAGSLGMQNSITLWISIGVCFSATWLGACLHSRWQQLLRSLLLRCPGREDTAEKTTPRRQENRNTTSSKTSNTVNAKMPALYSNGPKFKIKPPKALQYAIKHLLFYTIA